MLGLYVSDHPLLGVEGALRRRTDTTLDEVPDLEDGSLRTFGGVITTLQRKWTKRGDLMAVFQLEDLRASVEVMVFPKTMTDHGHKLADDAVVVVKAKVDKRDDSPKLVALDIEPVELSADDDTPLRVKLVPAALSEDLLGELKRVLAEHPGGQAVELHLGERKVVRLAEQWCVDAGNGLVAELRVLLGSSAIVG
jgi:DNA polymerase-3 subunit alpha